MVEGRSEETLRRALEGDSEAFGELVLEFQAGLYGFLRSIVHDGPAAEDLAQQTFLKAFRGLRGFRGGSSFKTWLYRIGLNEARSYLRWRRLRSWLPLETMPEPATADPSPDVERRLEIDRAMERLSGREREVVAMRLEGTALKEIARVLGLSEGTVKSYLFVGLRKMREVLR